MLESCTRLTFDVVDRLAIPVLSGTTFIEKIIRSIDPAERKFIRCYSPPVPILMVQEAKSETVKNTLVISQLIEQDLVLLVTPIKREPKIIAVARKVLWKAK